MRYRFLVHRVLLAAIALALFIGVPAVARAAPEEQRGAHVHVGGGHHWSGHPVGHWGSHGAGFVGRGFWGRGFGPVAVGVPFLPPPLIAPVAIAAPVAVPYTVPVPVAVPVAQPVAVPQVSAPLNLPSTCGCPQ